MLSDPYQGSGQEDRSSGKPEEPTIRQVVETAATVHRPVEWKPDAGSQVLLDSRLSEFQRNGGHRCMDQTRVVERRRAAFLLGGHGIGIPAVVLRDRRRARTGALALVRTVANVKRLLSTGAEDLPVLPLTGQRDLDRIVGAINGGAPRRRKRVAAPKACSSGLQTASALPRWRVAAGVAHEIRNPNRRHAVKGENASRQ